MAIAMSILDGERYRSITLSDYLHMDSSSSIREMDDHNQRLTRWVQLCILDRGKGSSQTTESRLTALKHFIHTAEVCDFTIFFRVSDLFVPGMSKTSKFFCHGCHCVSTTVPCDKAPH